MSNLQHFVFGIMGFYFSLLAYRNAIARNEQHKEIARFGIIIDILFMLLFTIYALVYLVLYSFH